MIRRSLQAVPLVLLISGLLFFILHQAPGGPLAPYLQNPRITAADVARLRHNFGLDRPIYVQYWAWLSHVIRGDFGYSTSQSEPVVDAILGRMPATLLLMGTSFVFSLVLGLAFGIVSALRPYGPVDGALTTFAFVGQSMPVFWFALMLQLALAVYGVTGFGWRFALPSAGMCADDGCGPLDVATHLVLPTIVLSLIYIATWSRFMRSSMLEVVRTDYMRTAKAKGLAPRTVVMKHGFRNALVPLVTIVALSMPGLVSGAVITEQIFAWPGMGQLFFNALGQFDFSLLMGYLMMVSILVVLFNILADVAYAALDPRVSLE